MDRIYADCDHDYWDALLNLRRQLEADGVKLICNGMSRDVQPSGMCRDMGAGLHAYRFRYFRKISRKDMVPVLEHSPWNRYATVEQQSARWRRWLRWPRILPAT